MRKLNVVLAIIAGLFLTIGAKAQSNADYFTGKWTVIIKGTPDGDSKIVFVLENKNDSIIGVVQDTTGKELTKITKTSKKMDEVTLYFNLQSYDLDMLLKKKDDDHVTGSLMSMFDVTGDRIKETK